MSAMAVLATVPAPAPGCRVSVAWGAGAELRVLCAVPGAHATASVVRWGCPSAPARRLAHESLPLLGDLSDGALDVRGFATALGAVLGRRHDDPSGDGLGRAAEPLGGGATGVRLAVGRAAWDLVETFVVDRRAGGAAQLPLADPLAAWLRRNAAAVAAATTRAPDASPPVAVRIQELMPALRRAERAEEASMFWDVTAALVAAGWTDAAVSLLGLHSAWAEWELRKASAQPSVELLEALLQLLHRMPRAGTGGPDGGAAVPANFGAQRAAWLQALKTFAENDALARCAVRDPATAEGVRCVLTILAGDAGALDAATGDWLELLVATLKHARPSATALADAAALARDCMGRKGVHAAGSFIDQLVVRVLELDAQEVMRVCTHGLDAWFTAHIPELLVVGDGMAEVMRRPLPAYGAAQQSEVYRLDYVASLLPHTETRSVAAGYLARCPVHGRAVLTAFANVQDVRDGGRAAHYAVTLAERHGLYIVADRLRRAAAAAAVRRGASTMAAEWLRAAGATTVLRRLAATLLPRVPTSMGAANPDASLVDAVCAAGEGGPALLARIIALCGSAALCAQRGAVDATARQAGAALLALTEPGMAPRIEWASLIEPALAVLECTGRPAVDSAGTEHLMARIFELSLMAEEPSPAIPLADTALRLALARNLARALAKLPSSPQV